MSRAILFTKKLLFISSIVTAMPLSATTVPNTWIAQTPNNDMNSPTNWSQDSVPGINDDAIFDSSRFNVDTNPLEQTADFSVSTFQFPHEAAPFTFTFDNQSLAFVGAGITGNRTNTAVNISNVNNQNVFIDQLAFNNGTSSTSGSAIISLLNSGSLTGSASGQGLNNGGNQLFSTASYSLTNGGSLTISNVGSDSTTGSGNNSTAVLDGQALFNDSFNSGDNATMIISNSGTNSGSGNNNHVGLLNIHQLNTQSNFIASDNFLLNVSNTGTNNGTLSGNDIVGAVMGAQANFNGQLMIGDKGTIEITNTGNNSDGGSSPDFVGYIIDNQLFVQGSFNNTGDDLTLTISNIGTDDSTAVAGGNQVARIDSNSGTSGFQMFLNDTCKVGDRANILITNSGTYTGSNTVTGEAVATMNLGQALITGSFTGGDHLSFSVINTGVDSSIGIGSNSIGTISTNQAEFKSTCSVGNHAEITIANQGQYGGTNISSFNYCGAIGSQLILDNDFQAGDGLNFLVNNIADHSGEGFGADYVGMIIGGTQAKFLGECTLKNDTRLTVNNIALNFSNCSQPVNVGSLFLDGQQMYVAGQFQAGDNLNASISNLGFSVCSGAGTSYVASILTSGPAHASQMRFGSGCDIGNNALISVNNEGLYLGTHSGSGGQVGSLAGQQFYVDSAFNAGKSLQLNVVNVGIDISDGAGSDFVGFSGDSQVHFNSLSTVGDDATISVTNSATFGRSPTGITNSNLVGVIANRQFYAADLFTAGNSLNLSVQNGGATNLNGSDGNTVGTISDSQARFDNGCTVGNNATITISNVGVNRATPGISNNVGTVGQEQLQVLGDFFAGAHLNLSILNNATNAGDVANTVGSVAGSQAIFNDAFTMGNGSLLTVFNNGTVGGSQIELHEGFSIQSGKATIQATNHGTIGGQGILIQGSNTGGDANIVLDNTSLYIDTTTSTFTIGELNGNDTSTVQSKPTLIIDTDPSTFGNFAGVISDFPAISSTLIKRGVGTQKLSGMNAYTGLTTVEKGKLIITGSLAGDVQVDSGGILAGTGLIEGNVVNMGTISPGESIGTLTIAGNLINNNGNYDVEVDGSGNSDLIEVGGTAQLNGGVVYVSSVDGTFDLQSPYTILTAANVTGTYSGATPVSPLLLRPILSYDPNNVFLTLFSDIEQAAKTHNQHAVARQLDSIINPNADQTLFLQQIINSPIPEARESLDSLSGYQHTDDLMIAEIHNHQFIRRLYDPLRSIVTEECCDTCCCPCECGCGDLTAWMEVEEGFSRSRGDEEAFGFHMNNYNITAGLQKTVCDVLTGGVAGSYEYDHIHYSHGGTGKSNTGFVGLYGLYRPSRYYGLFDLTYGYSSKNLKRPIEAGRLRFHARSKPKLSQFSFYGEAGFDLCSNCFLIQPFVGITTSKYWRRKVTEHDADGWGLSIRKKDWSPTSSRLGVHITGQHLYSDPIVISLDVAWNYLLSSRKNKIHGRFKQFGKEFSIHGTELDNYSIDYALTVSTRCCDCVQAYLEVDGESWTHASTYNILAGIEVSW